MGTNLFLALNAVGVVRRVSFQPRAGPPGRTTGRASSASASLSLSLSVSLSRAPLSYSRIRRRAAPSQHCSNIPLSTHEMAALGFPAPRVRHSSASSSSVLRAFNSKPHPPSLVSRLSLSLSLSLSLCPLTGPHTAHTHTHTPSPPPPNSCVLSAQNISKPLTSPRRPPSRCSNTPSVASKRG